ncbi:MAG: DUF2283 domain-containing protein [Ardenticatenales bacterium]|nr:DUF2283 domain-containing protein [Ardenticatenales bacterium]
MTEPSYHYDQESDTLYISFAPGKHVTGIELTDHILLRINQQEQQVVGITLFDYTLLIQQTDVGPRSFPLVGLDPMPLPLRKMVLDILRHPPVRDILAISAYSPNLTEITPIIAVQPLVFVVSTL